jgi:hypothetical protein
VRVGVSWFQLPCRFAWEARENRYRSPSNIGADFPEGLRQLVWQMGSSVAHSI